MIGRISKDALAVTAAVLVFLSVGRGYAENVSRASRPRSEGGTPSAQRGQAGRDTQFQFPGPAPGLARATARSHELALENDVLRCVWSISDGRLTPNRVTDKLSNAALDLQRTQCFQLILDGGRTIRASDLRIVGKPDITDLKPRPKSCRLAGHFPGKQITLTLVSGDENLKVQWRGILRDGSNYVRQQIALAATSQPIDIKEIVLWELAVKGSRVMGTVDGSPVAAGNLFFAYEHPLSKSRILQEKSSVLRCSLPRFVPLEPGKTTVQSSVVGVAPKGQLRRGFLYYVERQRAHPYRPFLHYNTWYDIGYGPEKIQQRDFIAVVNLFGAELIKRRGVKMDSFVLDDGWDNPASLWHFHDGFPNGFTPLKQAVDEYNSGLGAWLSPFGGYGQAKQERLKYGRQQGFETNKSGFSLAGPKYFARFRDVCVGLICQYGLNYFKFDGIGVGGRPTGTSPEFAPDMEALLRLISELRQVKPDVFINTTTGMWASPFWLWYSDSVWRSGSDWSTCGPGNKRQQQITYRDNETYHNVVRRAPLYPLNSLMTQGIMLANHGLPNQTDGFADDVRDFFASGTDCQELYITPSMMTPSCWDALAEAAKWSRDNSDVLVDTHWIGGDPAEGQIYGWASWSPRKGILSFRNPSDKPHSITIDIGKAFELPGGAAQKYSLHSPWKQDADKPTIVLTAGTEHTFELKPFEVLVFDATPR
jgi:hypothetical protein